MQGVRLRIAVKVVLHTLPDMLGKSYAGILVLQVLIRTNRSLL